MMKSTNELLSANSNVVTTFKLLGEIGWKSIKEQSIQRIFYLFKVLYFFINPKGSNPLSMYHFSASISGPYSELLNRSLVNLKTRDDLMETGEGGITLNQNVPSSEENEDLEGWFKKVIFIIGLYGENRIYGFTINDPLYKESIETNSQAELDTSIENKTIKVLNSFKKAFEESLDNVSQISKDDYLELYFEFVFSKIIKREE